MYVAFLYIVAVVFDLTIEHCAFWARWRSGKLTASTPYVTQTADAQDEDDELSSLETRKPADMVKRRVAGVVTKDVTKDKT